MDTNRVNQENVDRVVEMIMEKCMLEMKQEKSLQATEANSQHTWALCCGFNPAECRHSRLRSISRCN